jgi:hypothetical protein
MNKWDKQSFCAEGKAPYNGFGKPPHLGNNFILLATVLEDQDYGIPDENWLLPIAFTFGTCSASTGEILVSAYASLPPGDCLKEGERVQLEGEMHEDDGNIYPAVMAITRCDTEGEETEET